MAARALTRRRRPARLPRDLDRRRDRRAARSAQPGASRSCSGCSTPRSRSGSSPGARQHIDSGPAAIAQATVPIFSLLIGLRFLPHERIGPHEDPRGRPRARRRRARRRHRTGRERVGSRRARSRSCSRRSSTRRPASTASSTCEERPRGRCSRPARCSPAASSCCRSRSRASDHRCRPPARSGRCSLLSLFGTALAQLILFRVIALFGARRFSLVTYLMPASRSATER